MHVGIDSTFRTPSRVLFTPPLRLTTKLVWMNLECADEGIENEVADLDVESTGEVVPVELGGVVEEEVADE